MTTAARTVVGRDAGAAVAWLAGAVAAARAQAPGALPPVRLVVPTNLLGRFLVRALAETAGPAAAFDVRPLSLGDLAAEIVRARPEGPLPLPPGGDIVLLRGVIRERLSRGFFGPLVEADAPGLPHALLATLTDLRAAFVEPREIRAAAGRGPAGEKWRALGDALEGFEAALETAGLLDRVGTLRAAADAAADSPVLEGSAGVLLCGLHEATPAERRFLLSLRPHLRGAFVFGEPGLPDDDAEATARWDRATFDLRRFLRDSDDGLGWAEGDVSDGASGLTGPGGVIESFADRLLRGARPAGALGSGGTGPVRLVGAPSEAVEAAEAIRIAVEEEGVRTLAVLARDTGPYAEAVRDAAAAAGIGGYTRGALPLASTAEGQAALSLLSMLVEPGAPRLDRRAVVDLARTAPVREDLLEGLPADAAHAGLWDLLSAEARVVGGRAEWEGRLGALAADLGRRAAEADRTEADRDEARLRLAATSAFLSYVRRLDRVLAAVVLGGRPAPWSARAAAAAEAIRSLLAADRPGGAGPNRRREEVAECLESLAALDRLPGGLGLCGPAEFAEAAREAIEGASTRDLDGAAPFPGTGLLFSDLAGARFLPFDAVAVVGAAERAFPRPIAEDPLLPDSERAALRRLRPGAAPIGLRREKASFDAYLLGAAVGAARKVLVFSYPRIDPSRGRARIPSVFFLRAWRSLRGLETYPDHKEVRDDATVNVPASPVRRAARLRDRPARATVSVDEARLAAVLALRGGERLEFLRAAAPHAASAHEARDARRRPSYGPYDGIVPRPAVDGPLAPTEIDEWFVCPYQRLGRRLLRLQAPATPEEVIATEADVRGRLFHAAAEAAGRALLAEAAARGRALDAAFARSDAARRAARAAAECAIDRRARDEILGHPALWGIERREILAVLDRLLEAGFDLEDPFRPPGAEWFERRVAFDLEAEGGRVSFRGRIDRIDVEEGAMPAPGRRPRSIVRDYKTGQRRTFSSWREEDLPDGVKDPLRTSGGAQLPLYLEALRSLGLEPVRGTLVYVLDPTGGRPSVFSYPMEGPPEAGAAADLVGPAVRSIAAGIHFPVPGDACKGCDLVPLCGPRRAEIHGRKDPSFRRRWGGLEAIEGPADGRRSR